MYKKCLFCKRKQTCGTCPLTWQPTTSTSSSTNRGKKTAPSNPCCFHNLCINIVFFFRCFDHDNGNQPIKTCEKVLPLQETRPQTLVCSPSFLLLLVKNLHTGGMTTHVNGATSLLLTSICVQAPNTTLTLIRLSHSLCCVPSATSQD